jgi:hypothetical protein
VYDVLREELAREDAARSGEAAPDDDDDDDGGGLFGPNDGD